MVERRPTEPGQKEKKRFNYTGGGVAPMLGGVPEGFTGKPGLSRFRKPGGLRVQRPELGPVRKVVENNKPQI